MCIGSRKIMYFIILFLAVFYWTFNISWAGTCRQSFYRENQLTAHQHITEDLYAGEIFDMKPFTANDNGHSIYFAKIRNHSAGRIREAIVKPRPPNDANGFGRTPMEYVGYFINRLMGWDYVPPVAYKKMGIPNFSEAAVILFVPNTKLLLDTPADQWGMREDIVKSDWRILNVILQNPDGHDKNLLLGDHWVDGKTRPIFIDFAASLKGGVDIRMDHYMAFRTAHIDYQVKTVSMRTYEALAKFTLKDLEPLILSGFISETEAQSMFNNTVGIRHYFDQLIKVQGRENTIIEASYD